MKQIKRKFANSVSRPKGVAGLEVMVIIVVLLAAVTIAIPLFLNRSPVNRENVTTHKILAIKKAIVGDPQLAEKGNRGSFGFVGDLGVLPVNLPELLQQAPGRPAYSNSNNVWFGWQGPYLDYTIDGSGNYTALLDAWGRAFRYTYTGGTSSSWSAEIRSFGADAVPDNGDDIVEFITDTELRTYVSGTFRDRSGNPVNDSMVTVYFPNGTTTLDSVQISTNPANQSQYDSQTDTVSAEDKRKIPIGIRYLETLDMQLRKLASLNGGSQSLVNFVSGEIIELPAEMFERTFRPTDNEQDNQFRDIYTAGGGREIINNTQVSGGGYLTISGSAMSWPDDTTIIGFGTNQWDDYRIEANMLHGNGHKYQVFYRMSNLDYDPADPNDDLKIKGTGYGFEFDPQTNADGDYVENSSVGKVVLRIRKYQDGLPRSVLVQKEYSSAAFQTRFGYPILWRAHQVSITVQNVGANIEHHVLINGRTVFDTDIVDTGIPSKGPAGILVHRHTNFQLYHLLIHKVPPQPELPLVWWSFEEGFVNGNNHVYGFGYLNDAPVLTGVLNNPANINRQWHADNKHGQAIVADGTKNGYIYFGDVLNFSPTDVFSISLWAKITAINTGKDSTIISKIHQGSGKGWMLCLGKRGSSKFTAIFTMRQTKNSKVLEVIADEAISADKWYHIVVTFNARDVNIYVTPDTENYANDNSAIYPPLQNSLGADSDTTHNQDMNIGAQANGDDPFTGFIDEVRIYKRVLEKTDIEDLFQKDK